MVGDDLPGCLRLLFIFIFTCTVCDKNMARDVIPIDADKLLFALDLVNYVFRERLEVHVHDSVSDYRQFIYEGFDRAMADAVEFLEESLELEIDRIYNELKNAGPINKETYIQHGRELIKKSSSHGFDSQKFLNGCVHLAMLADNFYSDGLLDAPDIAFCLIRESFGDVDMMNGGWDCLKLIAERIQTVSWNFPTPSSETEEEGDFPIPDRPVARQLFRYVEYDRNRVPIIERINEPNLPALPRNGGNFEYHCSAAKDVSLGNINESNMKFLPGNSGNDNIFTNHTFSEKEEPLKKVNESTVSGINILPGSSGLNMKLPNSNSPGKAIWQKNVKESNLSDVPQNNTFFANRNSFRKVEKGSEQDFKFLPGSSGNNNTFTNHNSSEKEEPLKKANESTVSDINILPGSSRYNRKLSNCNSPGKDFCQGNVSELNLSDVPRNHKVFTNLSSFRKEEPPRNVNESHSLTSKFLPGSSRNKTFINRSSFEKKISHENVIESRLNFSPGCSGNNRLFANRSSEKDESRGTINERNINE